MVLNLMLFLFFFLNRAVWGLLISLFGFYMNMVSDFSSGELLNVFYSFIPNFLKCLVIFLSIDTLCSAFTCMRSCVRLLFVNIIIEY